MLNFDEIEDCFPERGALCAIEGRITVSAQWLHDFARAVAAKEREECAAICDRFAGRDMHLAECAGAIRMRSSNVELTRLDVGQSGGAKRNES